MARVLLYSAQLPARRMTEQQYRHALHLLNTAIALFERTDRPESVRRRLRALSLELDLLRAGIRQVPPASARN